ncbi:uncharacterized protein LOC129600718 [Paramacrobiotus metropolitanus]|uniref:uncharacterized protein LOC129600718 n=1 Tax=Paramacrobiotus metropolitanus TaxID=2943436 RepID=UPI0024461B7C|nr:uncharacterized protein LOC129600718 [Paramacrobiotus metropolitanus]
MALKSGMEEGYETDDASGNESEHPAFGTLWYFKPHPTMSQKKRREFCLDLLDRDYEEPNQESFEPITTMPMAFQNAKGDGIFLVQMGPEDTRTTLRPDGCGRWKNNGNTATEDVYTTYYRNITCRTFHKYAHVNDTKRLAVLDYWWDPDATPKAFPVPPHGNSKSSAPFNGTNKIARRVISNTLSENKFSRNDEIMDIAKKVAASGSCNPMFIPRDKSQVKRVKIASKKSEMADLMGKLCQEEDVYFHCTTINTSEDEKKNMIPVVCRLSQSLLVKSFVLPGFTGHNVFSPLYIDIVHNIGEYYVMTLAIQHPYLRRKETAAVSANISETAKLRGFGNAVLIVGTAMLTGLFAAEMQAALYTILERYQRDCGDSEIFTKWTPTIVADDNFKRHMKLKLNMDESSINMVLAIFFGGKFTDDDEEEKGIIDSASEKELDAKVADLSSELSSIHPGILAYYQKRKRQIFLDHALLDVRQSAAFGSDHVTNNVAESANYELKDTLRNLPQKQIGLMEIISQTKSLIRRQETHIAEAIIGCGEFIFTEASPCVAHTADVLDNESVYKNCLRKLFGGTLSHDPLSDRRSKLASHETDCTIKFQVSFEKSELSIDYQPCWKAAFQLIKTKKIHSAPPLMGSNVFLVDDPNGHLKKVTWSAEAAAECSCADFKKKAFCCDVLAVSHMMQRMPEFLENFRCAVPPYSMLIGPTSTGKGNTKRKADRNEKHKHSGHKTKSRQKIVERSHAPLSIVASQQFQQTTKTVAY